MCLLLHFAKSIAVITLLQYFNTTLKPDGANKIKYDSSSTNKWMTFREKWNFQNTFGIFWSNLQSCKKHFFSIVGIKTWQKKYVIYVKFQIATNCIYPQFHLNVFFFSHSPGFTGYFHDISMIYPWFTWYLHDIFYVIYILYMQSS